MEAAVRDALTKIEQQAIRYKKKTATIKRHPQRDVKNVARKTAVDSSIPPAVKGTAAKVSAKSSAGRKTVPMLVHSFPLRVPLSEPHVVRSSDGVALRPMSIEEALKEAAFRDRDVFVFRDYKGQAMVLHRKRDGRVELIEVP
jgi:putative sigma-54 modulation protein